MKETLKKIISRAGNFLFSFKKKEIKRDEIKKILIMSLYFRGDVLFNTAAIKMLKKIFPEAELDVIVKSRSKEVLKGNPRINNIIVFDDIKTADYNDSTGIKLNKKISLLKKIRSENYDLCIDFTGKYSTALIALLGGFKYSIGLNYNGFGFCYSKFIDADTQNTEGHLKDKYLSIIKEGLSIKENEWQALMKDFKNECEIFVSSSDVELASDKLNELNLRNDNPLIVMQVTAGWKAKEWSENNYTALIRKIIEEGHSFLLIGSEHDKNINFRILDAVSPGLRKFYLSMPLKINAAIISHADVFIGSDSIGLHLAGALGIPTVGLFGPTNPTFSGPSGEMHNIIYKKLVCSAADNSQYCTRDAGKSCLTIDCMKNISTDEVMENVEFLLNKYFHSKRITA